MSSLYDDAWINENASWALDCLVIVGTLQNVLTHTDSRASDLPRLYVTTNRFVTMQHMTRPMLR